MVIDEEKRYLYEQMTLVMQERRVLTDVYFELKKRMDELNRLESRGLDELSVKGYVDLHRENTVNRPVANVLREMKHTENKAKHVAEQPSSHRHDNEANTSRFTNEAQKEQEKIYAEVDSKSKDLKSKRDLKATKDDKLVREMQQTAGKIQEQSEEKEKELIPKKVIDDAKARERKSKRGPNTMSLDKAIPLIIQTLKQGGRPMKAGEIFTAISENEEFPIQLKNFRNNILPRAMQKDKRIERVMTGYYQVRRN